MPGMNHTTRWLSGYLANNGPIPAGIIVPLMDTSIPTGWSRYSDPDDKFIIGAGLTYNPLDTGGSLSIAFAGKTSDSVGSHLKTAISNTTDGGAGSVIGGISAGEHTHDFTADATIEPAYRQALLIKSLVRRWSFPANALVLWHDTGSSPSGLTQQYTADNDKLFKAGASLTSGGDAVLAVTSTSAGAHTHNDRQASAGADGCVTGQSVGAHTHDVDMTVTFAVKRRLLGLWTDAAAKFDLASGFIAMYESLTPPTGWSLCDGSGGTPDLRDYFLGLANQAGQGSNAGDNTLSAATPSETWSHSHRVDESRLLGGASMYHPLDTMPHAHSLSFTDADYLPPYYSLAFIKYTG